MTAWQPIETAPKVDDTDATILIWDGYRHDVVYYVGWGPLSEWFNGDVCVRPTHWMPLPEPPHE